jgi:hypothetical protein
MFGANAPLALQQALGGWQLTAINSASSGQPINVTYSPTSFQSVSTILSQRPNQISKAAVLPKSQRTRVNGNQGLTTLNLAAFSLPDQNHPYGSAGRNSLRFDPYYNLDLGLHKVFALHPDGVKLDFRAEAFNVLNQTNFGSPSSSSYSPTSTSFGVVTAATTGPARILQFAAKITF